MPLSLSHEITFGFIFGSKWCHRIGPSSTVPGNHLSKRTPNIPLEHTPGISTYPKWKEFLPTLLVGGVRGMFHGYVGKLLEFAKEMLSTKHLHQIFQYHKTHRRLRSKANISKDASADIASGELRSRPTNFYCWWLLIVGRGVVGWLLCGMIP